MKTLVIYAHPDTGGHCDCIMRAARDFLKAGNHDFEILDLYRMKYDPVLHEEEHYTRGNKKVSSQNLEIQNKIAGAQKLIFIYPVWWGSMPAMMKGFFDRVFTSGFAFRYENKVPKGLLKGKEALVMMTSGATGLLSAVFQGSRPVNTVKNDILGFCGISSRVSFFGGSQVFTPEKEAQIKKRVSSELSSFLG